jgi:hypothetical protein
MFFIVKAALFKLLKRLARNVAVGKGVEPGVVVFAPFVLVNRTALFLLDAVGEECRDLKELVAKPAEDVDTR